MRSVDMNMWNASSGSENLLDLICLFYWYISKLVLSNNEIIV